MTGEAGKIKIFMNKNVKMSKGKYASQAVHAALTAFGVHPGEHFAVAVLGSGTGAMKKMRVQIVDEGVTEIPPNTLTAATDWPEKDETDA